MGAEVAGASPRPTGGTGSGELDAAVVADQLADALLGGILATPEREAEPTVVRLERAVARLEEKIESASR